VGEADAPIRRGRIKAIFTTQYSPQRHREHRKILAKARLKVKKFSKIPSGFNFCFGFFFETSVFSVSLWLNDLGV
jgi:hypothetical protein